MITPFQVDAAWRDYWNLWAPPANAQFAPIADSSCYLPRIRMVPDTATQIMPPSGKLQYNFTVAPGSLMWAIWAGPFAQLPFTFQLTDIQIGHKLFQEPCSTLALPNAGNVVVGDAASAPSAANYGLLPTPWPIVGDGLLTAELWGTPGIEVFPYTGICRGE